MGHRTPVLTACLLATLAVSPTVQAADRPEVGAVEQVQARVVADYQGQQRSLSVQAPMLFEDTIETGADARFKGILADGTALTLGENASLLIDAFVYEPGTEGGSLSVNVTGAFLFVGGQIEGPTGGNVTITTPVATLGVRGTTFWGGEIDDGYGVLVLDGEVSVTTLSGTQTLTAGQGTMIALDDPNALPASPSPWNEDKVNRAVATITFAE